MTVWRTQALVLALLSVSCDQNVVLDLRPDARADSYMDRATASPDQHSTSPGWAIALGSVGNAVATGVVMLPDGTIAVAGQFSGDPDRILGSSLSAKTLWGIFVSRIDAEGRALWTVALPGPDTPSIWHTTGGIAADAAGNIYVGDAFSGRATFGAEAHRAKGETDLYVAKLDPDGRLLWATVAGGDGTDRLHQIAVDREGLITVTGTFGGTVSFGATTLQAAGLNDVLIARLSPAGEFIWATRAGGDADGGASSERGKGLALDRFGHVHIAASYVRSAGFEGSAIEVDEGVSFLNDTFVAKLDERGKVVWASDTGATRIEIPSGLAIDDTGDLHLSGWSTGQGILCNVTDAGTAGQLTLCPVYTKCNMETFVAAVAASPGGRVVIAGQLTAPCTLGLSVEKGPVDAFVAWLEPLGKPKHVVRAGGPGAWCGALGLSRAASGDLFVVGRFSGAPSLGGTTLRTRGARDGFIWKIPAPES